MTGERPPVDAPELAPGSATPPELLETELAPPSPEERRARARRALIKLAVLVTVVGAGFLALRYTPLADLLTKEALLGTLERLRSAWWTPLVLIGLYVVLGPLGAPISPLVFAGGAIYGPVLGSVYNFTGSFVAAILTFLVGRALGRDFVVHFVGDRLAPVERYLSHRGFLPLVQTRFLPLPFMLVNYAAALAGVRLGLFAAATAVGLLPSIVLFTWFWAAVASGAPWRHVAFQLFLALTLLMTLSTIPTALRWLRQRRR